MSRIAALVTCVGVLALCALVAAAGRQAGRGRPHDIGAAAPETSRAAPDITVFPDGRGLPDGRGTVVEGRAVYAARCAACHGARGEGTSSSPRLVGGRDTLHTPEPVLTVGSYWPYATTLWDYNRRAMPYQRPGSLTVPEVYAVTAYLLHLNGLVAEDAALDQRTLPEVRMPNRDGFVADARPDVKPRR
jgi:S-disulfanyl-L-cysteine oxidoreductase SoxD